MTTDRDSRNATPRTKTTESETTKEALKAEDDTIREEDNLSIIY